MFKDPVCGMDVDEKTAPAKFLYNNKTYYFCNTTCYEKFKNNPQQYITPPIQNKPLTNTEISTQSNLKINLPISGMSCASCAQTIENSLKTLNGVHQANVNFANETASVTFNPTITNMSNIQSNIEKIGYGLKTDKIILKINDMSCASCAQTIEKTLNNKEGIIKANINFATEKAFITYMPTTIKKHTIVKKIEDLGYSIETSESEKNTEETLLLQAKKKLWTVWLLSTPVIILMLLKMLFGLEIPLNVYFESILAGIVLFIPGFKTLKSGILSLWYKSANMDSLIMLGTLASFSTGILKIFGLQIENFAGVGAMIMSIHLTGRYIEASAKGKAAKSIKKLMAIEAKTAKIEKKGVETEIPIELLKLNDIMLIRPGEKIPTDGIIIEGQTKIDESMVTGESMLVKKTKGSEVIGGTINTTGFLKVKVTKIGNDTFLSQVIKLVEECQGTKVPIQKLADQVTSIFAPIVMAIALFTFLFWYFFPTLPLHIITWASAFIPWVSPGQSTFSLALFAAIAVLVIACPCALGLATPTALMVSSARGAKLGILFRSGEAIQTLKDVKTIVFDKTGTITKGQPALTDIYPLNNTARDFLLQITASLEQSSEHPLSQAIVTKAKEEKIKLVASQDFQSLTGMGIQGKVDNHLIQIGNKAIFQKNHITLDTSTETIIQSLEKESKTVIFIISDNILIGIIGITDPIKEDSPEAIKQLKSMGIKTVMLTGDNESTAQAIAKQVDIDEVYSNLLPQKKLEIIKSLQTNTILAMVGDGINDAPALTQANVGIAIGTGTDIAIESSDVTLVKGNLLSVVKAIQLSKAAFKKIKENLFWAFFYNIIVIPLAMLGLLHPIIAEVAMGFSSINVILNSIKLRKIKL